VCERAGFNPFLFQLVNIREQCAWMISNKDEATSKATKYIRAGIRRVGLHRPLEKKEIESNPDVLVIGGGIAGLETSLGLAGKDRRVYLVEKMASLGGMSAKLSQLIPPQGSNVSLINAKIEEALNNPKIDVMTSSEVIDIRGFLGNFQVSIHREEETSEIRKINVGAIVVATGFRLYDPKADSSYGGDVDNVITALELEEMAASGKVLLADGKPPRSVALIHCVGRKENGYCSKACCVYSIKLAHYFKDHLSDVDVTNLYMDLCLPHKSDQAYFEDAKKKDIRFVRADEEVKIDQKGERIEIKYNTDGNSNSLVVDMAVLAPAMLPAMGTPELAAMLNVPLDKTGFFKEVHEILNPVATPIEGVYIAGCALGPKNIPESVIQSQATAGKILASLIPGEKIVPEVKVAEIREEFCTGCQTCLNVCFYGAISYDPVKGISIVNEAICRGCGSCVGSCPSGAIRSKHFTYPQLYREVVEALR
jgi:heterodisulfide reductase subunit A